MVLEVDIKAFMIKRYVAQYDVYCFFFFTFTFITSNGYCAYKFIYNSIQTKIQVTSN